MNDEPPVSAIGVGGRQVRTSEPFGNVYDHFAIVYEYANGTKLFSSCRQMANCTPDVSDHIIGTHGSAQLMSNSISGPNKWNYSGPTPNMYQVEHNELFAAIRSRFSDQQQPLHGPQHVDGHHGPNGSVHGPAHSMGSNAGEQRGSHAGEIRMGPVTGPAGGPAGNDEVCLRTHPGL